MRLEGHQVTVNVDGVEKTYEMKVPVRETDRVYIVGCANTKDIVPYDDKDAEFWGVNNLWGVPLPAKWTRWFEIHHIWYDQIKRKLVRRELTDFRGQPVDQYMNGLASLPCPVYMQQFWPEMIPNSVVFPLPQMVKFFAEEKQLGLQFARYLTNTISIEIALAIFEGFKEIFVYGVDMAVGTEWQNQRPSCEFWLGLAKGMGINIYIPAEADLLKTRFIYGFEEPLQNEFAKKLKKIKVDMVQKANAAQHQANESNNALNQYQGAIHVMNEIDKVWSNFSDKLIGSGS